MDHWFNTNGRTQQFVEPLNTFRNRWPCIKLIPSISAPPPALSSASDVSHLAFAQFLRSVLPAILMVITISPPPLTQTGVTNGLIHHIVKRPDHLLPFREHAPTRINVKSSTYADINFLCTPEGLWSMLAHRGVFYVSDFALTQPGDFKTIEEWEAYYVNAGQPSDLFRKLQGIQPKQLLAIT
jgi:hypothetical protein